MRRTSRVLPRVLLVLAVAIGWIGEARAQTADTPEQLLETWQAALDRGDHAEYVACLHPGARAIPEYGSPEAMAFWARQLDELADRGFAGDFAIEVVSDEGGRLPPGAVRAHPIVNGQPIDESIVLVEEAGSWTILRLFS